MTRKAEKRHSTDVFFADGLLFIDGSWATKEKLPLELHEEDVGWQAGPMERELPLFTGPKPGPTNPALKCDSSELDFMDELITDEFKNKCRAFTTAHVSAWREKNKDDLQRGKRMRIDQAFNAEEQFFLGSSAAGAERFALLFDTWVAAKLRVAQLKPEIPAAALWGRVSTCRSRTTMSWTASLPTSNFCGATGICHLLTTQMLRLMRTRMRRRWMKMRSTETTSAQLHSLSQLMLMLRIRQRWLLSRQAFALMTRTARDVSSLTLRMPRSEKLSTLISTLV